VAPDNGNAGASGASAASADEAVNVTAAFDNLTLSNVPVDPSVETCLAHLKLLFAFQWMKEDVGFTDGLWGLWDSRAGPIDPGFTRRPEKGKASQEKETAEPEPSVEERIRNKNLEALSRVREKRWALFVARAVDRYETWWKCHMRLPDSRPLREYDMDDVGSDRYAEFPTAAESILHWTEDTLPPLDVLMVWHAHMLNPRAFLEDAMLAGVRQFWATGMPWDLVNRAIDTNLNYTVSAQCKARWATETKLPWDNVDGALEKTLDCPKCDAILHIPWTTCQFPEVYDNVPPGLAGNGYGDSNVQFSCHSCQAVINKEFLALGKFVKDHQALVDDRRRPMPGTLLDVKTGTPTQPVSGKTARTTTHTFPNRVLKLGRTASKTLLRDLARWRSYLNSWDPTMQHVRKEFDNVLSDRRNIKEVESIPPSRSYKLPPESRLAVRKMMSRYWENFSLFALDLSGAVLRQGVFVEKMCQLDWLHSPTASDTMARLITKYTRFIEIMKRNPSQMAVPTLDVDLAWHTHQLSPSRYYKHCLDNTRRFIDHDDKVDQDMLSHQFEWTSKTYQEYYGEVYSECTCWYCEGTFVPP
jgi:hypothetical protein